MLRERALLLLLLLLLFFVGAIYTDLLLRGSRLTEMLAG